MAVFVVLEAPGRQSDKVVFVKEGFSGAALVFTVFWAIWHRMWIVAAVLLVILAALNLVAVILGLDVGLISVIETGLAIIFGFEARSLQITSLKQTGYYEVCLIEASSIEAAELLYFRQRGASTTPATAIATPAHPALSQQDTLGIFGNI